MKIEHSIFLNSSEEARREFLALGIKLQEGFSKFKIDDADERWAHVSRLVQKYEAVDTVDTKFTAKEIASAQHLTLNGAWHHGYPEPSDDNGYLNTTYNSSDYCPICGIGLVQKKPFRFLKEPKWGARSILQVNWVFDEFFVTPKAWKEIFEPEGIQCCPVEHAKTGRPLETVVQLNLGTASAALNMTEAPHEICSSCGVRKFLPHSRGYFPSLTEGCGAKVFKSIEYFGSGAKAFKAVIITNSLCEKMTKLKVKGVNFVPLKV